MKIIYTSFFVRKFNKLPVEIKQAAARREEIFIQNPFSPALKIHKLKGRLNKLWSFSVNYGYRIIFEFADSEIVYFFDIGKHDIYK
ncbi:MAG: type II toxin-antitoxin system RelE/ParE family toxin [Patescibacteria group bacterium]|jgi:mRNA-degrading endonuclease YafQ of YafQ-DinJ toxin-antitoxin module